jgi:hypothetical protein
LYTTECESEWEYIKVFKIHILPVPSKGMQVQHRNMSYEQNIMSELRWLFNDAVVSGLHSVHDTMINGRGETGGIGIGGGNGKYSEESCPSAALFTINPT